MSQSLKRTKAIAVCAVALAAIAFVAGCTSPTNPVRPPVETPATVSEGAKSTLQNLPTLKMTLPKSLSTTESTSRSLVGGRAIGDTTDLSSVPSMKSQAWYDLQGGNGFITIINKAFDLIRNFAKDNDIKADTPFSIPITSSILETTFGIPASNASGITVDDSFIVSGTDGSNFSIYMRAKLSMAMQNQTTAIDVRMRFDISGSGTSQKIKMYFLIAEEMPSQDGTTATMSVPMYASYDAATGACEMVSRMSMPDSTTNTTTTCDSIQLSTVGTGGAITNVNVSIQNGKPQYIYAAYGDDIAGGIASLNSWTDQTSGKTYDSYWGEYYGTNGNLIKRVNGDTNLWVPIWNESSLLNLADLGYATAPTTIQQRSYYSGTEGANFTEIKNSTGSWIPTEKACWDNSTWSHYYNSNLSGSPNWISDATYGRSVVFKQSTASWTGGDAIYYWQNGTSEQDGDVSYWVNYLTQGYVVPTAVAKFGKSYYVTNEYPLNTILPLSASYATDYKLIQEQTSEPRTDTWIDSSGNTNSWTWTSYSYYLNKNKSGESPVRCDPADGDINISDKLTSYDMYYWVNGQQTKTRGYFYRTTLDSVPAYFCQPNNSLVSRVDDQLAAAMDNAYALDLTKFRDQIDICTNDPTAGKF